MTLTIFLARLLGLYCAIVAVSMLRHRRDTIATINGMMHDPGVLMIAGALALAGGLAVILGHNIWHGGWLTIAVTCVGWVMAGKGTILLLLPKSGLKSLYNSMQYERFFVLYTGGTLLLGLALLWGSWH